MKIRTKAAVSGLALLVTLGLAACTSAGPADPPATPPAESANAPAPQHDESDLPECRYSNDTVVKDGIGVIEAIPAPVNTDGTTPKADLQYSDTEFYIGISDGSPRPEELENVKLVVWDGPGLLDSCHSIEATEAKLVSTTSELLVYKVVLAEPLTSKNRAWFNFTSPYKGTTVGIGVQETGRPYTEPIYNGLLRTVMFHISQGTL